ncbi:MAG: hypothetical protein AMXMBFR53_30030 [Gemmatimonadota bacterium]
MKTLRWLVGLLAVGLAAITPEVPRMPRVVRFNEHPFVRRQYGKVIAGGQSIYETVLTVLRAVLNVFTPARVVLAGLLLAWLLVPHEAVAGVLLAFPAVAAPGDSVRSLLPENFKAKYDDYRKATDEALAIQTEFKGKRVPEDKGKVLGERLEEAESIWAEIGGSVEAVEKQLGMADRARDARERRERMERLAGIVPNPTLPGDEKRASGVAGYVRLSDYVLAHKIFQELAASEFRMPGPISNIPVGLLNAQTAKGLTDRSGRPIPVIALNAEQRKAFEDVWQAKSVVSIGSGVIEPDRLDVIPQVTADDRLRLRNILNIGQTGSSSVSYIREESHTRAAAETAPGSAKPEGALSYTEQTANVRTIPVWIPVTTDQLADWPQLRSLIDARLLYDLNKRLEEQIMYGLGTGQNLEGILTVSGTTSVAASALYTAGNDMLEKVRLGATEVMVSGYEPNALLIHPYDWFSLVVLKGTDDHYLGQVFLTADRQPRVWGLDVVETIAAQENSGVATPQRNWVVGDFQRGIQLLDRELANVMVGLNSDDFTKNRRTILAEARVALPIYAPAAFAYLQTQAEAT